MADFMVPAVIVAVLILINGLFVAAEFAIAGVSRPAMEARARDGDRVAGVVSRILGDPQRQDQYIATAQLGITFATLGLGMYGEHQLAEGLYHYFEGSGWAAWLASHAVASVLAIAIITYFHVVVGEMVPKALALQQPERAAVIVTPPMLWLRRAGLPLVLTLNGTGTVVLSLLGIRREQGDEQSYTPEELQLIIRESADSGEIEHTSAEMLQELFDFGNLDAEDVMVPRVKVVGIDVSATRGEALEIVRSSRHTRYPVYERDLDHIIGLVHIKDFLKQSKEADEGFLRSVIREVPHVPETSKLSSLLDLMRRERVQLVVALDEHGGTAGIVTMEDLVEEVVTPIEDSEDDMPELYFDEDGVLHAEGIARLEEVGEQFEQDFDHEDVETVSGLILMLLDRSPEVGDEVEHGGFRFRVTAVSGHGVAASIVTRLERRDDDDASADRER